MNVLFLTLANVYDINDHDIYQDLMRCFKNHGDNVYVVTGAEKRKGLETKLYESCGCHILRVKVGNQSDCSLFEKGLSTVTLQSFYYKAIEKHLAEIHFDLILYSTPPITLVSLVARLKKKYGCTTYLMLKDIFPQNAVDLGMMSKSGVICKYFRRQEEKLYKVSDYIGCMSEANIEYLLKNNIIDRNKVELCPNAVFPSPVVAITKSEEEKIKGKYGIPNDRLILLFGGNLGRPQGIPFLIDCLNAIKDMDVFVVIVGDGSEYANLEKAIIEKELSNTKLIKRLPREEYLSMSCLADVGLIFLDYRFTIPNFPSRVLPYMENEIPIICATDIVTDIGDVAKENGFGWKCLSNDVYGFTEIIEKLKDADLEMMGSRGRQYLEDNYNVERCYSTIRSKC